MGLPEDDHLESDELVLQDVWGAFSFKGEVVFLAGGAGVTPFLSFPGI
ncbi:MAG: hypothetical protein ABI416_09815 [Ginsengibacter sp.]